MDYQAIVEQAKADVAAERLIRGTYWNGDKGCFVGCLRHGPDHSSGGPLNAPEWFWQLCDFGHGNCPSEKAADNYIGIVEAVAVMKPTGFDDLRWQSIFHELMALMLERALGRVDKNDKRTLSAIQGVIDYHRNPNRTEKERKAAASAASAAESAAWSAWSAAVAAESAAAAAESAAAAWSASRSAWSAAVAAESAAWSAWSAAVAAESAAAAAESAAAEWSAEEAAESAPGTAEVQAILDDLMRLIREAK